MGHSPAPFEAALSPEEWILVRALRDVPPGALRDQLGSLIAELVAYVRTPRCAEVQGDGAPCASLEKACAECQQVAEVLAKLGRVLQHF